VPLDSFRFDFRKGKFASASEYYSFYSASNHDADFHSVAIMKRCGIHETGDGNRERLIKIWQISRRSMIILSKPTVYHSRGSVVAFRATEDGRKVSAF
jgi:hypothetical protein